MIEEIKTEELVQQDNGLGVKNHRHTGADSPRLNIRDMNPSGTLLWVLDKEIDVVNSTASIDYQPPKECDMIMATFSLSSGGATSPYLTATLNNLSAGYSFLWFSVLGGFERATAQSSLVLASSSASNSFICVGSMMFYRKTVGGRLAVSSNLVAGYDSGVLFQGEVPATEDLWIIDIQSATNGVTGNVKFYYNKIK